MKKTIALIAVLFSTALAQAETMSCYISVYKAEDIADLKALENEKKLFAKTTKNVEMPVSQGSTETNTTINGEKVRIVLTKQQYTDVYYIEAYLETPAQVSYPSGDAATIREALINSGPSAEGTIFAYMDFLTHRSGTMALTTDTITALRAAGLAGKYPFDRQNISAHLGANLADKIEELVKSGKIKKSDTIGMEAKYSCTRK